MLKVLLLKTTRLMGGMHCICEHIYLRKTYGNPNGVFMTPLVCKVGCALFSLCAFNISNRDARKQN